MKLLLILAVLPLVLATHNRSLNDDYHENSIGKDFVIQMDFFFKYSQSV